MLNYSDLVWWILENNIWSFVSSITLWRPIYIKVETNYDQESKLSNFEQHILRSLLQHFLRLGRLSLPLLAQLRNSMVTIPLKCYIFLCSLAISLSVAGLRIFLARFIFWLSPNPSRRHVVLHRAGDFLQNDVDYHSKVFKTMIQEEWSYIHLLIRDSSYSYDFFRTCSSYIIW